MGSPNLIPIPNPDDKRGVVRAIQKLASLRLNSDSEPTFAELTIGGNIVASSITVGSIVGDSLFTGYIDYDPAASPGDGTEGRTKWNSDEHTLDLTTGLGPVLQVGQESFVIVYNDTGSTIYNGTAVYPVGAVGGRPSVAEAAANTHVTFAGVVLVTTMDIPNGTEGIVSQDGKVRGVDTTGFTLGDTLWLSEDGDGILNNLTNVRPSFPSYAVQIGGVAVEDADGTIQLAIVGHEHDTIENFFNGTFREPFDFRVTEDAGTVTGTLTPSNGHPDMTMIFSDGFTMLDTDPGATIDITAYVGTDDTPVTCYVFIPQSTKVMTADTAWPLGEHIRIATLVLQSAVTTGTSGALRNQNWNDEIQNTDTNQGHLSHLGQRIRAIEAEWNTGAEATLTVADTANSYVSITSGKVFQMHEQTYPALAMPAENMEVVNDPDSAYTPITSLNEITKTSDGGTIPNNRWFSVVIWGVCNKSDETSHLMCNVPAGDYTSEENAQIDALGYSNYNIPKIFKGVGFLIARFTVQRKTSTIAYGGGASYQDLRGFIPNSTAGSGAGGSGVTTFLALTDTPSTFVGESLKLTRVNVGETALEFTDQSAIDHGSISGLGDVADHLLYLDLAGTRAMTGDIDHDGFDILDTGHIVPDADNSYDLGSIIGGEPELIPEIINDYFGGSWNGLTPTNRNGQQFTTEDSFTIQAIDVAMRRTSGTGDVILSLWSLSSGLPDALLATSTIDGTTITADSAGEMVLFVLDSPILLDAATMYGFTLEGGPGFDTSYATSNPYHPGGDLLYSTNSGSSWNLLGNYDVGFITYSGSSPPALFSYRNLYLSGMMSDGTDSLTVAEAKEAYDHIHNLTTDIDHASITNTHNLTTDIDHATITNNHDLTTDIDHDTITNNHNLTTDIDHDTLLNYDGDQHIDWSVTGIEVINADRYSGGSGGGGSGDLYVDRGDPSSSDFEIGDLTADGSEHDMDLSSIVPVGATAVSLTVKVEDNATGSYVRFRSNGNSNTLAAFLTSTQVSGIPIYSNAIVALDADRIIEYKLLARTYTTCRITVVGWWIPAGDLSTSTDFTDASDMQTAVADGDGSYTFGYALNTEMARPIYVNPQDLSLFTQADSGSGSALNTFYAQLLRTGTTVSSKSYSLMTKTAVIRDDELWGQARMHTDMILSSGGVTSNLMVLGWTTNPSAPTTTEEHAAFRVVNGLIYASVGSGSAGTQTSTGVTMVLGQSYQVAIHIDPGSIKFFVDGVMTEVTTNLWSGNFSAYLGSYIINTAGVNRETQLSPLFVWTN